MPEGDTIHRAARRIEAALVGKAIVEIETPHPRHRLDRWPERLSGRLVRVVDARGKHLFLRFDGDITLHSHLRMGGLWSVYRRGERWRRSPRRAWLVIRTPDHEVVQFDGPVLELVTDSRTRFDPQLSALGPDLLADDFDEQRFLRRLREDDQTRAFGDALLDQRNVAGLGNIWRAEACFHARVDPHRRTANVTDEEALTAIRAVQPLMARSVAGGWPKPNVYKRAGRPCPRCGTLIEAGGLGDDNRTAYWCPGCQT
ncbi:MAG TPA: DNA-formamidopyrimidine glycosylase family protein [Thermoleophilaceae bacterium]